MCKTFVKNKDKKTENAGILYSGIQQQEQMRNIFLIATGAILVYLVYSPGLSSPFILDDIRHIRKNPGIRAESFGELFSGRIGGPEYARPLSYFFFRLDYLIYGYNPAGYHITNLILHLLAGTGVFFLSKKILFLAERVHKKITREKGNIPHTCVCAMVFFLFLVHPAMSQAVLYITQRMTILAALFIIFSAYCYLLGRTKETAVKAVFWFVFSGIFFILAFFSKENAAVLPLVLLILELLVIRKRYPLEEKKNRFLMLFFPAIFILICLYYVFTPGFEATLALYDPKRDSVILRLVSGCRVMIYAISLFFFPHPNRLCLDPLYPKSTSLFSPVTGPLCIFAVIFLLYAGIRLRKKNPAGSFCIFFFFLGLFVESTVLPISLLAEHRFYLSGVGAVLFMVWGLNRLALPGKMVLGIFLLTAGIFSFWTLERARVWNDPVVLALDTVQKAPANPRAHHNLGVALVNEGRIKDAITAYTNALQLAQNPVFIHNHLGVALMETKEYEKAWFHLKVALSLCTPHDAAYPEIMISFANLFIRQNQLDRAYFHLQNMARAYPDHPEVHALLGVILFRKGKTASAKKQLNLSLSREPANSTALFGMGMLFMDAGKYTEAIFYLNKALEKAPYLAEARNNLGVALIKTGKLDQGIAQYRKVLETALENREALNNLGLALMKKGDIPQALVWLKKAADLYPDDPNTLNNLGVALYKTDEKEKAQNLFLKALEIDPGWERAKENLRRISGRSVQGK